jgi:predicted ATP-binding protein involved in virulence
MRIDKLKLTDFKNFHDLEVDFSKGINLFVGVNGSGKTAILDAVCVALGGYFASREQKMQRVIEVHEIRITADGHRVEQTTVEAFSSLITKSWARTIKSATKRNDSKDVRPAMEYGEQFFEALARNGENRTVAPLISYHSTQRLFKDASDSDKQKYDPAQGRSNGYIQCLEDKAIKRLLSNWMGGAVNSRATKHIKGEPYENNVLENVESAMRDVLIGCVGLPSDFPLKVYEDPELKELVVSLGDGKSLPLAYYSDGYRNLIFLVMDIVWRASQLNPWLNYTEMKEQSHGVVVIDEIDLHLHPKWQGKVIPILHSMFPNVQFFISSHSPIVVSSFNPAFGQLHKIEEGNIRPCDERFFGKEVSDILKFILGASDRHAGTQEKLDELFKLIDSQEQETKMTNLLDELTAQLGREDGDLLRARSLIAWNAKKRSDSNAVH